MFDRYKLIKMKKQITEHIMNLKIGQDNCRVGKGKVCQYVGWAKLCLWWTYLTWFCPATIGFQFLCHFERMVMS